MLSIDEAIAREREMARIFETKDFAEYRKQLAEWLEELKRRREYDGEIIGSGALNNAYNQGYNKAIDDFVKEICKMIVQSENNGNYRFYAVEIKQAIADLREQLKAGVKE